MWILETFCCWLDLFQGCIIIGISGLVISIVGFGASYQAAERDNEAPSIFGFVFFSLYLITKVILLLGVIWDVTRVIFVAFILSVLFTIIALIALIVWVIIEITALEAIVILIAIIVEAYFCWVIYSYWRKSQKCDECPDCI